MNTTIRPVAGTDAAVLTRIYNHYIGNTHITFETEPVVAAEMVERIARAIAIPLPWLVAEGAERILGDAFASRWKGRCA